MRFRSVLNAVGATLLVAVLTMAEESPWPMFRHDLHHTGRSPYSGPADPTVRWVFTAKDGIVSSPSIGRDGTIYVGAGWYYGGANDSSLYAINPDGSLKWRFVTNGGVFSSPTIGPDGTIYVGSLDRHLYAIEDSITYGKLKWRTHLRHWIYSSPVVGPDGTVYVGSLDFSLYALNADGRVKWTYPTDWCVFSSPAIGPEGEIYVGSKDEHLYALEDSVTYGKLRWKYAAGEFYDGHLVDSSPAIGSDGTIYVGTDPYGAGGITPLPAPTAFFAITPHGRRKWAYTMEDGAESSPAIGPDGTIYVGSYDSHLYAFRDEGSTGVLKWRFPTRGSIDCSPAVDACGTVYVGSRDSTVYAIHPDGSLRWSFPAGGAIECSPTISGDGMLYIGTFDGNLYALGTGRRDVGVVSIELPKEVKAGFPYSPRATVRNHRTQSETFPVFCRIGTADWVLYADTLSVEQLTGATSTRRTFAPWTAGPDTGSVFALTVATFLDGDENEYNDTLSAQVRVVAGTVGVSDEKGHGHTYRFSLGPCYPNPFNAETAIEYELARDAEIVLALYNVLGQAVNVLVEGPQATGRHSVRWDGNDSRGEDVTSGVYFCRMRAGGFVATRKIILLR